MSRWGGRGHAPRLPAPKQHHQHARAAAAAAAAAAAVIVARGRGSKSWDSGQLNREQIHMRTTRMPGPLHRCCSPSLRLFVSSSLLVLNRAKGPAGLIREGQKYIFWGCGEGAGFYYIFMKFGVRDFTRRYGIQKRTTQAVNATPHLN